MAGLPPMRGPWAMVWAMLASPWTTWALGLWIALGAALGLAAAGADGPPTLGGLDLLPGPGQHPASSLLLQLPAGLLVFTVLARRLNGTAAELRWTGVYCLGLATALAGGWLAGGEAGLASVGGARPTESYTRPISGRTAPAHLGGQLQARLTAEGVALTLGVDGHPIGDARLPLDGVAEARLGPWAMYLADVAPGSEPAYARLKLTPRAGGEPVERAVRVGSAIALDDGTQIVATRLSPDFGQALGPAAQLRVQFEGGAETAWHFVDSPDLDARTGGGPWQVELLEVATEPRLELGVRRAGSTGAAMAGFGLMALALLGLLAGQLRTTGGRP